MSVCWIIAAALLQEPPAPPAPVPPDSKSDTAPRRSGVRPARRVRPDLVHAARFVRREEILGPRAALRAGIGTDETVIGVCVGDSVRAYPVARVAIDEVLNDTLGDAAIAITWCVKCQGAVVYQRTIGDVTLALGNAGSMHEGSMWMVDDATQSHWSQISGIATDGAFAGTQLVTVPSTVTTLGGWLQSYPNCSVLAPTSELSHRQRVRLWDPSQVDSLLLMVRIGEFERAYPLTRFPESGLLHDVLGDEPIVLLFGSKPKVLACYSRRIGEEVIELDAAPVAEDIELIERGGARRWSAVSGRSRPLRSARPLRPMSCFPITREAFEKNYAAVDVFGGPLPPPIRAAEHDGERGIAGDRPR